MSIGKGFGGFGAFRMSHWMSHFFSLGHLVILIPNYIKTKDLMQSSFVFNFGEQ